MHDPMTVAFEIVSPIPRRKHYRERGQRRWGFDVSTRTNPENLGERTYPWWRPRGYTLRLAGRAYGLRGLATVWHVEPDGRDSGEVCPHYHRRQRPDGTTAIIPTAAWRWHVRHWRLQLHPLQDWRRRLLTRCEWCRGPHRKRRPVNNALGWETPDSPWWHGERGLYHRDCASASIAARMCVCSVPVLSHRDYGTCAVCGGGRSYGQSDSQRAGAIVMKECQPGQPPSLELMARAQAAREALADSL